MEYFGSLKLAATASTSITMDRRTVAITDTSRPTVVSEVNDALMFNWVVEPAGNGNFQTSSLL